MTERAKVVEASRELTDHELAGVTGGDMVVTKRMDSSSPGLWSNSSASTTKNWWDIWLGR